MPQATLPAISYPPELPVSAHREELLTAIRAHQVVVVAGETGSGKTTQLPKLCLELGRTAIGHTQPRRLAARTVAERIAEELKVPLGQTVGYAVRFDDRSSRDSLIRVMTDGLLLAQIQRDKLLRRYDTIIVDEAHERSLNVDFLLAYVKSILPKRPDLKLVITSATIDPERFSRHFGDAPVVEVSGRTYPVEVRYRPVVDPDDPESDPDRDQIEAIGDAVAELQRAGPGDVLVFLSGEREIRDTAEALSGRLGETAEILPLYARLSAREQHRVFQPHHRRRIVLATNVAETSLTVPGIRYVVDPGTARISRYSPRLKVQRLPIERVSQASADQRKGRCGRTSDGICIRLYTEQDFDERPRFTDPEILRTSLASVILQLAALGLGSIERLPFLDPPDRRQVRDGVLLLQELGALDGKGRLTKLGRRLARLPVDPRMGRMVLEAGRLDCADEVIVIAAALSIQDPRERPVDMQQQADQAHARFAVEDSDFLAYLNLWRYLRGLQGELSGNQFRKRCRAEFLHYLRVREWQDLVGQLRRAAHDAGVIRNQAPAEPQAIHSALLAGLLSHVGMRDPARRDYAGARGARFAIFPGSVLAKQQPAWVMAAELVETSRLWGREVARIQPQWIEPVAGHLIQRTYSEPRWERSRASVVATERVTLYGLPIVAGRTVAYGRIDPSLSRELFVRRALVEGDWDASHDFLTANAQLVASVEALEERVRERGILAGDQARFAFFDARIPADVVSGAHFDRWWREQRRAQPDLLTYTRDVLLARGVEVDEQSWPTGWRQGDLVLRLEYKYAPGDEDDGVTVRVPLQALGALKPDGFEWLVPALRLELVTALLRALPKELRRPLVPIPETAAALLARLAPRREPLLSAMTRALERLRGVRVPDGTWDLASLPPYLRMRFRVEDDDGRLLAAGYDLDAVRAAARPRLRAQLAAQTAGIERSGLTAWTVGTLPRSVELPGTGVRAYPALVDEGDSVAVRVLDTPEAQFAAMRAGTRRLLLLTIPSPLRWVRDRLDHRALLALSAMPQAGGEAAAGGGAHSGAAASGATAGGARGGAAAHGAAAPRGAAAGGGGAAAALDDALTCAADALMERAGGPAWDAAGFARLRDHVASHLAQSTAEVVALVVQILDAVRAVERRLDALSAPAFAPARRDVRRQLARLVRPGFVAATGAGRLADVLRYLRAAERRLERLPDAVATDADRMRAVHELEDAYRRRLEAWPRGRPLPAELREVPWLLEELRVSHFAQALGTRQPVSSKRIRRALAQT